MSPQYLWYTVLDLWMSPVAISAFGAGCMSSSLLVLAVVKWFVPWYERTSHLTNNVATRPPADEWESTQIMGCWMNVTHRVSISPFYVHVVNEDTQNTETCYLPHDQARSLAAWILDHLRGVPK